MIIRAVLLSLAHTVSGVHLEQATQIVGLFPFKLPRSYFCLGHFYMLEESCKSHLKSIYKSLYHWNSNSAECTGEYSDLICGVNMSLLIQINSTDQITLSSPTSLNSAVKETNPSIPKQLVALQYFLLIRCVLGHYNLFHSMLMLQQLSIFLCMLQWSALGLLAGCLVKPKATSSETRPSVAVIRGDHRWIRAIWWA